MTKYEAFYDYLLPDMKGCPLAAAKLALKSAAVEFCAKSLIYQVDSDAQSTDVGVQDYDLDTFSGYVVHKVMEVRINGAPVPPISIQDVEKLNADWRTVQNMPTRFLQRDPKTITLIPVPDAIYTVVTRLALKPSRTSSGIEDFLFEDYAPEIAAGAKAILMSSPNKPYTDLQGAAVNSAMFQSAINSALQRANRSFVRSDIRVRIPKI